MENIKIGIDCHNLEGQRTGVGRYLWNLISEWSKQDFVYNLRDRVNCIQFFLYFKNEIPNDIRKLPEYPHDREDITKVWNYKALGGKSNALFKHYLLPRAVAKDNVYVLFCPDYVLPIPLVFLSSFSKLVSLVYTKVRRSSYFCIKTAVTIHDIIYEARPGEYSWPSRADKILLRWASKQSAKKADIIFVPSEFTRSAVIKYYKVNPKKVVMTPLAPDTIFRQFARTEGVEELRLPPPVPSPPVRGRVEVGGDGIKKSFVVSERYFLFVGSIFNRRFLPQKIKGFAEFAKKYTDFSFLIIGNNNTKPYQDIGALVAQTNAELGRAAVIWKDYASDEELVRVYNGAFATLWISSYEGFGLPILESMACGTPVITSRAGSLPEVAGNAALYIENPQNGEEITSALSLLARDSAYYNTLVQKGITQAAKFSWQKCGEATIDKIKLL